MSLFSFLRKYGETEDPLFKSMPVTEPPPDEGNAVALSPEPVQFPLDKEELDG